MTDKFVSLSYWEVTKNIYYSLLFILPMLFIYEIMCWIQFSGKSAEIRNGADVFLRQLIMGFGKQSESIYGLLLIIVFFGIMLFNRNVMKNGNLKFTFLLYMLVESLFWSIGFLILMSISEKIILSIFERNIIPEQFYLAIGAGIWEELLFRVFAIGLCLFLLTKIIKYSGIFSVLIAILFSAVLFSLFHYIGPFGDIFTYKSFYIRTWAGIFLGFLYLFRGLGITVYTHIFYDISIICMPILLKKY
jgi:membrane protease YdiL (CAAX protease family)